jgi:GTP-sensing pleiotropic transcriptional regulator CodY
MTTSENANVARLQGVRDPLARAKACQEFLINGRQTLESVQEVRDEAIREVRRKLGSRKTIDEIAAYIGAKRNVVVNALRGM